MPTFHLLSTLIDALGSDVFLSALGGGAGGGVVGALVGGGITWWVTSRQTEKLFDHEHTKAANEREIAVLDELLPILHDVEARIPHFRVVRPGISLPGETEDREFARDRLYHGQRAIVPRSTTQQVRDRYGVLVQLIAEFESLREPTAGEQDEYGDDVPTHPEYMERVRNDIRGWIAYVRDTIEARMTGNPLPENVVHPPNLKYIDRGPPWDWKKASKHTLPAPHPVPWWTQGSGRE